MKTALYSIHRERGAKFFNFNGWEVPLEYTSIKEESLVVRESCGMFDISHMGRILLKGRDVLERLNFLTTNNLKKLYPGRVQYNLLSNAEGGVIDDVTVYMISQEEFLLCVNAVNREKVFKHIKSYVDYVEDLTQDTLQIALQGPKAQTFLSKYFNVEDIKYYHFKIFGDVIVSRTGYTGEDGFEIYAPIDRGLDFFKSLADEVVLCGFGARDILRIEAGFPLYGNELSEDITPFEANLKRFVSLDKDFLGKEIMLRKPIKRMLFGLELLERGVPRKGYRVFSEGKEIGYVSSGTYSYYLNRGIALCFVDVDCRKEGAEVEVEVRNKKIKARLRGYPFVKKTS